MVLIDIQIKFDENTFTNQLGIITLALIIQIVCGYLFVFLITFQLAILLTLF